MHPRPAQACTRPPAQTFTEHATVDALLDALFTHVPDPAPVTRLAGDEICRRAGQSHPGKLQPPALSSLRRGRVQSPSLATVAALAAGFEVDIALFTIDFHHRHRHEPMTQRVLLARIDRRHYQLAAALHDLKPRNRDLVLALVDILERQGVRFDPHA